jgi:hypothetical protein
MRLALRLHPDSRSRAATRIDVDVVSSRAGSLILSYVVTGRISELHLPPVAQPAQTDELWKHTCFEAFIRPSAQAGYYEFNFAPSTQWAAYHFDGYRSGMRVATEIAAPHIEIQSNAAVFTLRASLELDRLLSPLHLGLSAVLEETNGDKSYWALAHPQGKPDFHHADCFAHEIL